MVTREFPQLEVNNVYLEDDSHGFYKLITAPEKCFGFLEARKPYLDMRTYLLYVHRLGVCPFTSLLESSNGYHVMECNIPVRRKDVLHDIAQMQEDAMASIMPDKRTSRNGPFPAITMIMLFTGVGSCDQEFFEMLEEVRSERRLDLIDKRMAIAIAHPLHPLGGNANGTGLYDKSDLPLFVSDVPMMLTRYLHPMDEQFMHSKEEHKRFNKAFPAW